MFKPDRYAGRRVPEPAEDPGLPPQNPVLERAGNLLAAYKGEEVPFSAEWAVP